MTRKIIDAVSLVSIAVVVGDLAWVAIWGESPRAVRHLSIQSKILAWDAAPIIFGSIWLIFRYGKVALERFPRIFGHRGLLYYFALVIVGVVFLERLFLILSKLVVG